MSHPKEETDMVDLQELEMEDLGETDMFDFEGPDGEGGLYGGSFEGEGLFEEESLFEGEGIFEGMVSSRVLTPRATSLKVRSGRDRSRGLGRL